MYCCVIQVWIHVIFLCAKFEYSKPFLKHLYSTLSPSVRMLNLIHSCSMADDFPEFLPIWQEDIFRDIPSFWDIVSWVNNGSKNYLWLILWPKYSCYRLNYSICMAWVLSCDLEMLQGAQTLPSEGLLYWIIYCLLHEILNALSSLCY